MFDALSEKLNGVFKRLGAKGRLTERDVDEALREVRLALLEADVNFRVARDFVGRIREQALREEVLKSLSPGQQVVKITNDELTGILGGSVSRLQQSPQQPSVILLIGLNGSGKTTTAAKLASHLKKAGQTPVLVAADLQRPAAIEQLEALGAQAGVAVYQGGTSGSTVSVAADGVKRAAELNAAWAIVDTAGRFQIDDGLMAVDVTISFPGQGTSSIALVGSYEVVGDTLTYELTGSPSSWTVDFDGPEVLLTQTAPDPADNTIRLRRVQAGRAVVSTPGPGYYGIKK